MIDAVLVSLAVKSLATALIVVVASIAAERGGPFWGGIAVTLPVTAGPAYVMLALDHPPDFIAASALTSFASYPATWVFLVSAVKAAPHFSRLATLAVALAAWAAAALALQSVAWTASGAAMANVAAYGAAAWLVRRPGDYVHVRRAPAGWGELAGRAGLVGIFIAGVVTISGAIGPAATGLGAVFPIAISSLTVVLHGKLGGKAVAATMRNAIHAVAGTGAALGVVHLATFYASVWLSLALGLGVALAWSAILAGREIAARYQGRGVGA